MRLPTMSTRCLKALRPPTTPTKHVTSIPSQTVLLPSKPRLYSSLTTRPSTSSPKPTSVHKQQITHFSTTTSHQARSNKKGGPRRDPRITLLRYHLYHPRTPRPLRFSRLRALRHWTIHRAWLLHQRHLRENHERELERMYQSQYHACETLRNLPADPETNMVGPKGMYGSQGYLYRKAMEKKGVWGTWPIEAARVQTEWPSREGWNGSWRR